MKLTKTVCDKATYQGKGKSFFALWDDELPGFGLRIQTDEENWTVQQYYPNTKDERKRWKNVFYHNSLEAAIQSMQQRRIRKINADTPEMILKEIQSLNQEIFEALQPFRRLDLSDYNLRKAAIFSGKNTQRGKPMEITVK